MTMDWGEHQLSQVEDDPTLERPKKKSNARPLKSYKDMEEDPSGRACPDCHTTLQRERARPDEPFCTGCAADPGKFFHYVTAKFLMEREARREAAAKAMSEMCRAYYAPKEDVEITPEEAEAFYDLPIDPDVIDEDDLPI